MASLSSTDANNAHQMAWVDITYTDTAVILDHSSFIAHRTTWQSTASLLLVANQVGFCGQAQGESCYFKVDKLEFADSLRSCSASGKYQEIRDVLVFADVEWGVYIPGARPPRFTPGSGASQTHGGGSSSSRRLPDRFRREFRWLFFDDWVSKPNRVFHNHWLLRLCHTRLALSLGLGGAFDLTMLEYVVKQVLRMARPDMMVMFGFEFAVLSITTISTVIRYAINLVEIGMVREQKKQRIEETKKERMQTAVTQYQDAHALKTNNNASSDPENQSPTMERQGSTAGCETRAAKLPIWALAQLAADGRPNPAPQANGDANGPRQFGMGVRWAGLRGRSARLRSQRGVKSAPNSPSIGIRVSPPCVFSQF
ncbi:hypothetical protein PV10_04820 [Exophiala mesophila]|uniref:E3 ubiquitin-protein ligase synoviolin-like TPR repeats domain-containing protein n=1 Tax=Exophiala mesophila TaxID=212818 RepID=A0A0D1ZIA8_EXOME|nr:uncharacterized protein PV10_04820 [Exophiala mesophila]KIV93619.1 hypothetical protein PV10_04820 [Exophiala mesophila]